MSFEQAADAVVRGDIGTLRSLLSEDPELVRARSERGHGATLLHYLGANGVEEERQVSPANAVEIGTMLLDGGSEVDAVADLYGKSTTLGLVASSTHPRRAGVQIRLLETLLQYGAHVDGGGRAGSPLLAALGNGHVEAAEFLVQRGAALDLEGASGVGNLSACQSFFHPDGSLTEAATRAQMERGFLWACEYGRTQVMNLLLDNGVDVQADGGTGLTGLHWAVVGPNLGSIELLLQHKASLEATNSYGGTALEQAVWFALNGDANRDYIPVVDMLVGAGAKVRESLVPSLQQEAEGSHGRRSDVAHHLLTTIRTHSGDR